jgi:hypothetical protein
LGATWLRFLFAARRFRRVHYDLWVLGVS